MNIKDIDTSKWDFKDDGWGGIDEKIKPCVVVLNLLGINTAGSCSGHPERNNVMPHITISSSSAESDDGWSKDEDDRLNKMTKQLLFDFYNGRDVADLRKIVIEEYDTMSSLHNGGDLWVEWRTAVNDRVRRIKNGEMVKRWVPTEEEIREREIISKELLSEFDDFTEFLFDVYEKRINNKS